MFRIAIGQIFDNNGSVFIVQQTEQLVPRPNNQTKSFSAAITPALCFSAYPLSSPHICSINVDLFASFHNTLVEKGFGAKASSRHTHNTTPIPS